MKIIQRLRNIWNMSELEITPKTKEQITNIINPERPRQAKIIKMKSDEQLLKELLEDK